MGLSMFFLGGQAMVVQLLLMREMLAAFSGNELTIGAAFGVWFAAISAGALIGRRVARFWAGSAGVRFVLGAVLLVLALLPPVLLFVLMRAHELLGIPVYEGLSFGRLMVLFLVVLGPVCLAQGFVFPCACRLAGEGRKPSVSRIYGLESLGCLLGGLGFGVAVWAGVSPLPSALVASALGLAALAASRVRRSSRVGLALLALAVGIFPVIAPRFVERVGTNWEAPRWARMAGEPAPVTARRESPYQRLTVVRMNGQSVLVANRQPLFMFPDPVAAEPLVHSVLARHPDPRSVLLVGGSPSDLGRALLAHAGCSVTYVETDPWIWALTRGVDFPGPADLARFHVVRSDPAWYVRQAPPASFDVVMLVLPEPETVGLNRFYTAEFYRALRRLLRPGGVVWTSVEATEELQAETGLLAASVYKTLSASFPSVQVTFGSRIGFFAAEAASNAPMDRVQLAAAATRSGVQSASFKPDQFLSDESIEPVKMARTRTALEAIPVEVNTLRRPVTHTFMLLRWNRFSGSGLDRLLWRLAEVEGVPLAEQVCMVIMIVAILLMTALFVLKGRKREAVARGSLRLAIAVAGFSAMAFELILIFLAQSLFGYVYERLAFLVALFMAGVAAGAWGVRRYEGADTRPAWSLAVAACGAMVVMGVALPLLLQTSLASMRLVEWVLQLSMVAAGGAVGVLFPMVNRLLRGRGEPLASAAGETHAADNLGAAIGALAVGVVLIPSLGVGLVCFVVAFLNAMLALVLAAARRVA